VVPRLAADIGRQAQSLPTPSEFAAGLENDLAAGVGGVSPAALIEERRAALLRLYKVSRVEDLPINFQGIVFSIQDEVSHAAYDKHYGALERAIDRQIDAFEALTVLSPRMAVNLVSQELAGTSVHHQRHFEQSAEAFRRKLMQTLNRDIALNSRGGQTDYRAGPDLWRQTGGFAYEPESLRQALARCAAPFTVLSLWMIVALALAAVTARRLRAIAT
jgi:ABC-2 type transport system permease protein